MIVVQVNGKAREIEAGLTVAGFLESIGQEPRLVAIELNGDILKRRLFEETELKEGEKVEVVRFVQGG